MLGKILSQKDCAECKLCCSFYKSEIWEVPVIDDETANLEKAEYEYVNNNKIYKINYNSDGLYYCPALNENGCVHNDMKPFDCKIWPFRVMKLGGYNVIALSPLCKKINDKPLTELIKFIDEELVEKLKAQLLKNPALIKNYADNYVILKVL